jgi:general secretion pathway protein I
VRRALGFTLVEVLAALAILAIALAAASRAATLATASASELKLHILAGFVAENRMAELAALRSWPAVGATRGREEQAGIAFEWRVDVLPTPHLQLRRVEVSVADPDDPTRRLRRLVGVIAREK